jgi:hypothetical protein
VHLDFQAFHFPSFFSIASPERRVGHYTNP